MARIAGVDLPRDKRIVIGLTYIFVGVSSVSPSGVSCSQRERESSMVRLSENASGIIPHFQ